MQVLRSQCLFKRSRKCFEDLEVLDTMRAFDGEWNAKTLIFEFIVELFFGQEVQHDITRSGWLPYMLTGIVGKV